MEFKGNYVAIITPFHNGEVDYQSLEALVERQIEGGVSGLVPCGTTGESPTLTHKEHDQVIEEVIRFSNGRVPVIAGTGSNSTNEAIRLTRHAEEAGAYAALVVSPYYNKPSQEGLRAHFEAIADSTSLPIVLYQIPGRCSIEISLETISKLAEHPRIQAIKEATGNLGNISELRRRTKLQILSGDDNLTLPTLSMGGSGVVSVLSNLLPKQISALVQKGLQGEMEEALSLHERLYPLMRAMFLETNPQPIKTALALKGFCEEEFRLPLVPMEPKNRKKLQAILEASLPSLTDF
jgi:4-hydroxy-tetrahydrodipicolinate synthase